MYSYQDVISFVEEENVGFIRLAFCDVHGNQKNIAIMPGELERAFEEGISFDASSIDGFDSAIRSDLFLHPDPSTLSILPWRSANGHVVRMFCDIKKPDGTPVVTDSRKILRDAVAAAAADGISCNFGVEFEFYLFKTDENGKPTITPYDEAGYFDIAPLDRGENIRREICYTLQDMGITPVSSHHEEGPGQQEIDFKFSNPMTAADNATTFKSVVQTVSMANGAHADFSPKPLQQKSGNGMHINISLDSKESASLQSSFMAGIMDHIQEITFFLNPTEASYQRLGEKKAPKYVSWSYENRSQLIRIPAASEAHRRIELRSPDPGTNPYIAYALLIYAGLDGIKRGLTPTSPIDLNLYTAPAEITDSLQKLPPSLKEARHIAASSQWLHQVLPQEFLALFGL